MARHVSRPAIRLVIGVSGLQIGKAGNPRKRTRVRPGVGREKGRALSLPTINLKRTGPHWEESRGVNPRTLSTCYPKVAVSNHAESATLAASTFNFQRRESTREKGGAQNRRREFNREECGTHNPHDPERATQNGQRLIGMRANLNQATERARYKWEAGRTLTTPNLTLNGHNLVWGADPNHQTTHQATSDSQQLKTHNK